MATLVNKDTRVICQGITGAFGAVHTRGCLHYGTRMVGGVTPGKGGTKDENALPIFDTVDKAVRETGADATMIFVPPAFAADAVLEAAAAGIRVICCITEGVPVQDMIRVRAVLDEMNLGARGADVHPAQQLITLIGPNCPGIITPGPKTGAGTGPSDPYTNAGCKIGIMPGYIHTHVSEARTGKAVGIVSRSGTLTYEAVWQCSRLGIGQSTCIGIGGDPVRGVNHVDCLKLFEADPETHGILMIGEIGGTDEEDAAAFIKTHVRKPVAAFIAGRTAPPGKRMGHAGAIISGGEGTADSKIAALRAAGATIAESPADMGNAMATALKLR
ncbi:MAG: succinate--CoA ligase subunit alpha [Leptolyngbya sp. PLA2]|nr:succinate--CoA ligase subunit alpha [Leptolyngbya sp.]MCE7972605.1 succinate--CoA ligase subunit alpha [Leptolyngbya sp. PL-A2]MCZ7634312.1 succinate--CoA ligase subunit alpha [Phycisphaerales bacterium]MDL1904889.1 succinate--CoA ligase subunit alpha [Synechococcales cyanobacterium CNB]GIK19624.1 MAG: succinate--CoA ligase [ADP-forming] subunit alpha [Planctomycetota bacterium]